MVKICVQDFSKEQEEKYSEHFSKYPYELSTFQKYAIEGIVNGAHVLVTAHTGSGKTLPAEHAIEYFISLGKKVIYTAPIKALSNQKYNELKKKFPHISFGILTGDIKTNPSAQVLIMTTEILMNELYLKSNPENLTVKSEFEMDFQNELGCVIFDEVHYINDPERGHVWEESIIMLPKQVQILMLSATIDKPEEFANWIECIKEKEVYLCSTNHRVVPLTHYTFLTVNTGIYKKIKDKNLENEIKQWINKPNIICSSSSQVNDLTLTTNKRFTDLLGEHNVHITRQHVLNEVCKHMVENEMLPALCFVLSRKQLEICAKEITFPLLEFDSKVSYTIRYECEQIIRKLPNYQEYLDLPEYQTMVSLLEKGIAIHHSGVMPVLKEMVEILYGKGYIKLLFATETFSIGVNMPTKTVVFTDITKYDGNTQRILYSHEYTQMAGRAGRRGIDTVGNVIHLTNLFRSNIFDNLGYKNMMSGKPQTLISKFKISYPLVLNLIQNDHVKQTDFEDYAKKSMIQLDLDKKINGLDKQLVSLNFDSELSLDKVDVVNEYIALTANVKNLANKKRKDAEKRIEQIKIANKFIDNDVSTVKKWNENKIIFDQLNSLKESSSKYINSSVLHVVQYLEEKNYIKKQEKNYIKKQEKNYIEEQDDKLVLTELGSIAIHLREVHCLIFSNLIISKRLESFEPNELACIFSCFTNIGVQENYKSYNTSEIDNSNLKDIIDYITKEYEDYDEDEKVLRINSSIDYTIHYDLVNYIQEWCLCEDVIAAKLLLQKLQYEKGIFLGEFVKAILKICNIANEMIKIAEINNSLSFLHKLQQISHLLLKFVATNQSLYV